MLSSLAMTTLKYLSIGLCLAIGVVYLQYTAEI